MKLDYLKINGFGNIENKEIIFQPGINIIKGNNETGKTTLLKFIAGMLYGLSRNKNGKPISEYERYTPWKTKEFSGKMKYHLDSGQSYEIYREFSKKSPKLYNQEGEEITKQYGVSKNKESNFFYEQTKISEELLFRTAMIEQQEVKLEKTDQNILLQKISNIITTGKENISYQKAQEKLNEKQKQEIGNERTSEKPINIVNERIKQLERKEEEIELNKEEEIEKEIELLKREIKQKEKNQQIIKQIKQNKEKEILEKEKLKIKENTIKEYEEKINNIKSKKQPETKKTNNKKIAYIIFGILIIFSTILVIAKIKMGILATILGITTIDMIYIIFLEQKNRKQKKAIREEIAKQKKEIEILEETKNTEKKEIEKKKQEIKNMQSKEIEKIRQENISIEIEDIEKMMQIEYNTIDAVIQENENHINMLKVKLHTTQLQKTEIEVKKEQLTKIKEEQQLLEEEKEELYKLNRCIELAKEGLAEAYEEIKQNITPEFIEELSNMISKMANGKYEKVKFNDEEGLTVELESGEYVPCERLSIGTIDQMYLALRLTSLKQITQEKMPLLLDEVFAYYDKKRLTNTLKYISTTLKEYQTIILTCTNREQEILQENQIPYQWIEIK